MWLRKKKLKSLIRFHSANKIDNYNRLGCGREKNPKESRASQNIRIIIVFLESLLSESFPSLGVTVHLISLGCFLALYWFLDLLWEQFVFEYGPTPMCSYLQCPQLSELVCFLLWELSVTFYIYHRPRTCLIGCVDLICSLCSWWEGSGSPS